MIRRINFFGGPGAGKSTMSTYVFSALKTEGYNIEYVPEYIKFWTYIDRKPDGYDELYTFAKQLHREDTVLRGGAAYVVSDSPLYLSYFYAEYYGHEISQQILDICRNVEVTYPSLNIFLDRGDKKYNTTGRYQDEAAAKAIDLGLKRLLDANLIPYHDFLSTDKELITNFVMKVLDKNK